MLKKLFLQGLKDSSYYLISNIASQLIRFAVFPILTRLVSLTDFAIYDMFLVVSAFLKLIVGLGMDSGSVIIITENLQNKAKLSFVLITILSVNTIFAGLLWLIVNIIFVFTSHFFFSLKVWNYLFTYLISMNIVYNIFNYLRFKGEAKSAAIINFLSASLGIVFGLIMLLVSKDKSIVSFLMGLVIGNVAGMLACIFLIREELLNFRFIEDAPKLLIEMMKLSLPYVPTYLGNQLMRIADRLVILNILGTETLGLYAVVLRIAALPSLALSIISKGFYPVLLKNCGTDSGKKFGCRFYHLYILCMPFAVTAALFLARPLILLFGGQKFSEVYYLIPIAIASTLLMGSFYFNGYGFVIERKTYIVSWITFVTVAVNVICSLILVQYIGLSGVALGTLIASLAASLTYTYLSEKLYTFGYNIRFIAVVVLTSVAISVGVNFLINT